MHNPKVLQLVGEKATCLFQKSQPIPEVRRTDPRFRLFLDSMFLTMIEKDGVGLAAPQVGESLNAWVNCLKDVPSFVLNSRYEIAHPTMDLGIEGCLSFPGLQLSVPRYRHIVLFGTAIDGKPIEMALTGYPARVVQHEIDHCEGVCIPQRALRRQMA